MFIEYETIPDPIDLKSGWIGEEQGMSTWPRLYLTDIIRFYDKVIGKCDLIQRIECEYTQGKAYRYFSNNFIGEVYINNLDNSKFCLFRTKCVPSQRVSMKQYDVWAVIRRDCGDVIGGEILSAYCTCTAGLLGSCNHVAGLLFRVEAAVLTGVSHPTCTGMLSSWNVPTHKKQIEPGEVSSFLFTQDTYMKKSAQTSIEKRKEKTNKKLNFQVMSDSQSKNLLNTEQIRVELYNEIVDIVPNSCFVELMEARKKRVTNETFEKVPTLLEFAESFKESCSPELNVEDLSDMFADSLFYSDDQIKVVYNSTISQANSQEWVTQRHGRVTASKFKDIYHCALKLKSQVKKECPPYIISNILGYSTNTATWQMKHGVNTEIHAKAKYKSITRKVHEHYEIKDPGMTILSSYPFISVSPDLEIDCSCHGPGLVEIKCPASLIGQIPSHNNYHHLEEIHGELFLKKSSQYYFQVQGQMGVTNRTYCDFFVFTFEGYLSVRVSFDENFWSSLLDTLVWFWRHYIAPEMLSLKLKLKMSRISEKNEMIVINKNIEGDLLVAIEDESTCLTTMMLNQAEVDIKMA